MRYLLTSAYLKESSDGESGDASVGIRDERLQVVVAEGHGSGVARGDGVECLGSCKSKRRLVRRAEELQHAHCWGKLLGRQLLQADYGPRSLVDDHLRLVSQ